MSPLNRRRFLALSAATAASLRSLAQSPAAAAFTATLALHADKPGPKVPYNFIGLSYETQQLSDPTFFSPANKGLIEQFRALAPHGVLRLGGNTSDYGFWKPTPTSKAPPRAAREYKVGDPPPDLSYAVTPAAVTALNAFLVATGWSCIYGINLGTNTPALAASEAAYVARTLGHRLEYFQIGNEADRFATTIRDPKVTGKPWNFDAYFVEWQAMAKAILARVPTAKFGLPDGASNNAWITAAGTTLADNPLRRHVASLSHHYYVGGPPSNPKMTTDFILAADPRVAASAALIHDSAARLGVTYRMTEGNTCYRGGKPGVSDVFAASLWSADYLLTLASLGYSGVNLHGGDGQMVANSLGGKLPGDEMVTDDPANHPHPYYTPIAHIGEKYLFEPVAFGMKFAGHFAGATIIPVDFNPGTVNATAYAAKRPDGSIMLALINKDATQSLRVDLPGLSGHCTRTLRAPSLTSYDVQWDDRFPALADYLSRNNTGGWDRSLYSCSTTSGGTDSVTVPPATAVLIDNAI